MQQPYWDDWKQFLTQRGLIPVVCAVLDQAGSLLPIISQFMFLGLPMMKPLPWNNHYQALLNLLSDENEADHFSQFLREVPG